MEQEPAELRDTMVIHPIGPEGAPHTIRPTAARAARGWEVGGEPRVV